MHLQKIFHPSYSIGLVFRRAMNTWNSRRANALGLKGAVSCDQPLAAQAGLRVLEEGGTAADAAVAVAATLSVVQPASCGLGGDCWALYYEANTKKVHCLNGHGRTAAAFTRENLERLGFANHVPLHHAVTTAVPGAPAAICALHDRFGNDKLSLRRLFDPAIRLARDGFAVSEIAAHLWRCGQASLESLKPYRPGGAPAQFELDPVFLNPDRRTTPKAGQIFRLPDLAQTFETIADNGPDAFYKNGRIARAIVDCQQKNGGLLSLEDLAAHKPDFVEPVKIRYKSKNLDGQTFDIYETPPGSQGMVTLECLQLLSQIDHPENYEKSLENYYHALIESLKLSFADLSGLWNRSNNGIPPSYNHLLSESHAIERAKLFDPERASILSRATFFDTKDKPADTTYFCVADQYGNGCSMVYSTYAYFGTGYVPEGCGFTLSNRAYHVWEFQHKKFTPSVRPFSTLMAGLMTKPETGDLAGLFGIMGGPNQPQGHLQILMNLLEFGHTPQQALNRPRLMIDFDFDTFASKVNYEEGIAQSVIDSLRSKGHTISKQGPLRYFDRNMVGRGSIISRGSWWDRTGQFIDDDKVLWAGCDPRSDGVALVL